MIIRASTAITHTFLHPTTSPYFAANFEIRFQPWLLLFLLFTLRLSDSIRPAMADDSPDTKTPFLHVGPNNHGPAVVVSAYVLVMISILTTLIRLGGIFRKKRRLSIADGFIIIASVSNTHYWSLAY